MANIPSYQRRANGTENFEYISPDFKQFTEDTFGILIYQEQVMKLAQIMAGYSKSESNVLRKSIGKKKVELLNEALDELKARLIANGHSEAISESICEEIRPFGQYGFNRSHAAAYAFVACQTAYFKARYPLEFFTSLLTVNAQNVDDVKAYIDDAQNHGITVLPPDVNSSKEGFSIEGDAIRMGFASIKGIGQAAVQSIIKNQPYTSLEDYYVRSEGQAFQKNIIENLTLSGAMDNLVPNKNRKEILASCFELKKDKANFAKATSEIPSFNEKEKLQMELALLGFYATGHPLKGIGEEIDLHIMDDENFTAVAILSHNHVMKTKKGDDMAIWTLMFLNETLNALVFPQTFSKEIAYKKTTLPLGQQVKEGMVLRVTCHFKYNFQRDERSLIVDKVTIPARLN